MSRAPGDIGGQSWLPRSGTGRTSGYSRVASLRCWASFLGRQSARGFNLRREPTIQRFRDIYAHHKVHLQLPHNRVSHDPLINELSPNASGLAHFVSDLLRNRVPLTIGREVDIPLRRQPSPCAVTMNHAEKVAL